MPRWWNLVDTHGLGPCAERCEGSSPSWGTKIESREAPTEMWTSRETDVDTRSQEGSIPSIDLNKGVFLSG